MSAGENHLRAAMEQSVKDNKAQMELTEESRVLLTALLREEMASAVLDGITQAMSSPDIARQFALAIIEAIKQQATTSVNAAAGDLVRVAVRKALFFTFAGLIVYWVGGWAAIAATVNWLRPGWLK